ncbi:MAG: hypothetical protein Q7T34_00080 [Candidatus Parcubacteria bacterium]|nr:hypothetical protein [Candidatus Parcubacteria bacterium]
MKTSQGSSAQQFLEIDQIKEGIVILKNRALRGVIMVSSQNFALKSEDEQTATIYQFQNFLNSLDFSIQILVQSRKINMTGYIQKLKDLEGKQQNELMKIQTADYTAFVEELIKGSEIMAKSFYVVVPFTLLEAQGQATTKNISEFLKPGGLTGSLSDDQFQRCKNQLWQRIEFVALGLRRCGLYSVPLSTPELIELYWSSYHPEEAEVGYYPELPPEILS